jgi:hypothetical protein
MCFHPIVCKNVKSMALASIQKNEHFVSTLEYYNEGLLVDPRKVAIITTILTTMNVTKIKCFLGVTRFYWKYFNKIANKTTPIYKIL